MQKKAPISRRLSLQPVQKSPQLTPIKPLKILILGPGASGKTQLLNRILSQPFSSNYHRTVEELHSVQIPSLGLSLSLMDTAGSYEFPAMRRLNIVNSDGFLMVFSVEEGEGQVEETTALIALINANHASPKIVIAANKSDLLTPSKTAKLNASKPYSSLLADYSLIQTSALTGTGVQKLWRALVQGISGVVLEEEEIVTVLAGKERRGSLGMDKVENEGDHKGCGLV